ncbi:MAG: hypothetical protein C7B45_00860 [Sulfobacillus acidophilus]|uniref:Apea-like HEPN domain-containing protein n=1 Tax=Sulfobacillus acidophilus TaxID=53633 RepID=A0A2T2WNQ8_9FIRM|nr:MAG: hypothetical protein C7B45_00860 [Sulfobacillus acidophilus]
MAVTWQLGFVLPNLQVPLTVNDLSGFVALASYRDSRVTDIRQNQRGADKFLDGFRDVYGAQQQPGSIIWRDDICQDRLSLKTFVDFRNIVALAAILPGWAGLEPRRPVTPKNPLWSDAFDFHPGRLNSEGAIEIYNPAQTVFSHPQTPFIGMPAPHVPVYHDSFMLDWPLLANLLQTWDHLYLRPDNETNAKKYEPLFRSLEMAYRALSVPIHNEGTIYDFGTSLALWVSALEILAHPDPIDKKQKVDLWHVLEVLARAQWNDERLKKQEFCVTYRRQQRPATFVQYLYDLIYRARNTFLHGNPIEKTDWQFTRGDVSTPIGNLAPVIYRTALMCYLGWDMNRELAERMAHVVTYHQEWAPEFQLDNILIVSVNQMYEDAFLTLLST